MRTVIQTSVLLTTLPRTVEVFSSWNTAGMWEQPECHWTGLRSNEVLRNVTKSSSFMKCLSRLLRHWQWWLERVGKVQWGLL